MVNIAAALLAAGAFLPPPHWPAVAPIHVAGVASVASPITKGST